MAQFETLLLADSKQLGSRRFPGSCDSIFSSFPPFGNLTSMVRGRVWQVWASVMKLF